VVHNGIIENYQDLREDFLKRGVDFTSETDTEVLAHLIGEQLERGQDLPDAVRTATERAVGAYALVVVDRDDPGRIVAGRLGRAGGGVVVGHGEREHLVASDVGALLPHTSQVTFLQPGEIADIRADQVVYFDASGAVIDKTVEELPFDPVAAEKGPYKHFMLKEIHEQPDSVLNALRGRYIADRERVVLDELPFDEATAQRLTRVVLVGMGTSKHAAMVGRHYIERFARLPAEVDNASEFRYREPVLDDRTLVVSVAQSGETVDTLAAMDEASRAGCPQVTLCNTPGAQSTRVADATLLMRAGPEIAVASTKTMATSMLLLHALALRLGRLRGVLPPEVEAQQVAAALHLPAAMSEMIERSEQLDRVADRYAHAEHFLFLGRGLGYPMALEGALKLKEVSYIHAEGYAAGEMKHGPIALINEEMPTVAIAPRDDVFDKMRSNIEQVRARKGEVIAIVNDGDHSLDHLATDVISLPAVDPLLSPFVTIIPMQLLAYGIAVRRGTDVDQPRNLAKTVTVE
jgi:glucosamine--fructose-6-phosphate aminotransferase (isomerizing)